MQTSSLSAKSTAVKKINANFSGVHFSLKVIDVARNAIHDGLKQKVFADMQRVSTSLRSSFRMSLLIKIASSIDFIDFSKPYRVT